MEGNYILGISAGRKDKVTENVVKNILQSTGKKCKFYSLSDFEILTCDGCNGCIETHRCIKNDRINEIINKMEKAKGVVFGAPNYWDGMNAKGRAFWERVCFSSRHNNYFPFKDKPGIIVGVSGDGNSSPVINELETFFKDTKMKIVDKIEVQGEYACFTCGFGGTCSAGGPAEIFNKFPLEITDDLIPGIKNQHPEKNDCSKNIVNRFKEAGIKLAKVV